MVGMAEIKVTRDPGDVLMALGLGSCIGICAYDRQTRVAGMVHVVLPQSLNGGADTPGKFADLAVPALMAEMVRLGASARRVVVAIAGGAQLFSFNNASTSRLEIGNRNASAVDQALRSFGLSILARDVGGGAGRTVHFHAIDGRVRVKTLGRGEVDLITLGTPGTVALPLAA